MAERHWTKPKFNPKYGLGLAGAANNFCHGHTEDGQPCKRRALAGGYYCKAHVPKQDSTPTLG